MYINLVDQKEPKLDLENVEVFDSKHREFSMKKNNKIRKIIKIGNKELELHKNYLKSQLKKNFYE